MLVLFIIGIGLAQIATGFWDGIVSIDAYSFDKVITDDRTSLVKFDVKNPYGDNVEEWKKFAVDIGKMGAGRALITPMEINCHSEWWWNDNTFFNVDLAARFNVSFPPGSHGGNYKPVFMLFKRGQLDHPIEYRDKEVSSLNLKRFVQRHTTDVFFELPGCLAEFEQFAVPFLSPPQDWKMKLKVLDSTVRDKPATTLHRNLLVGVDNLARNESNSVTKKRKEILKHATKAQYELGDETKRRAAQVYIAIMKKVIEEGPSFIIAEKYRIQKVLDQAGASKRKKGSAPKLSEEQRGHLERKLNILSSFRSPTAVSATDKSELAVLEMQEQIVYRKRRFKVLKGGRRPKPTTPSGPGVEVGEIPFGKPKKEDLLSAASHMSSDEEESARRQLAEEMKTNLAEEGTFRDGSGGEL